MSTHALVSRLGDELRSLGTALATPAPSRESLLAHASSRWVRRLPYVVACGFTLVLLPSTAQVLSDDFGLQGSWAGVLGVTQAAPLLLAVTRPLHAWWVIFTADTVGALMLLAAGHTAGHPWPWTPMAMVGYLVLCLALGLRESRRTLLAVWLTTLVVSLALGFLSPAHSDGTNVLLIVLSGATLLLGAALRERAEAQRRLAEQETISETERARRTLLEERTRIARELHDVVAHHMSVISVQADSAPYRIAEMPPQACEEFGTIAATARESLTEMRRLLGVLRSESAQGERAPQPGLEQLDQLVEATVRAGVPAELHMDVPAVEDGEQPEEDSGRSGEAGGRDEVSAPAQTVTLSVYRIVQEALANVVRHAPGAPTRISVTTAPEREETTRGKKETRRTRRVRRAHGADGEGGPEGPCLSVLVVNGPSPLPQGAPLETAGTGHGLVGMRERVRLVGGALDVGPLPDGGFRVAARLPLRPPPRVATEPDGIRATGAPPAAGGVDPAEPPQGTTTTDTKDTPSA